MARGSKPTHNIVLGTRAHDENGRRHYTKVGVAWMDKKGRVTLQLNPGTVLDHRLQEDYYISLYPEQKRFKRPEERPDDLPDFPDDDFGDDDIPF